MIRTLVAAIAALMLGGMAGFYVMEARTAPLLSASELKIQELEDKLRAQETDRAPLEARAARLEKENAKALAKLDSFNDEMNQLRALANEYKTYQASFAEGEVSEEPVAEAEPDGPAEDGEEAGRRRRDPEREAEWAARRDEFRTQMQDRVGSFFDEEWKKAADPATQERLAALEEYSQFMMDARQRMREAESDEAREALQAEYGQARQEMQNLMNEQRTSMLQDVAKKFGVAPDKTDKFVKAMEKTVESPFFRPSPVGGGFRGGGPGEGGWGRRGGGGRGDGGGN